MLDEYGNTIRQWDQVITRSGYEGQVTGFDLPTGRITVLGDQGESWHVAQEANVQLSKETETYEELRATASQDWQGHEAPLLVLPKQYNRTKREEHDIIFVVAIAEYEQDAMMLVQQHYGLSVEDQRVELSHINLHGNNGKIYCVYVTYDTQGIFVMYGMHALAEISYDLHQMVESYFMP